MCVYLFRIGLIYCYVVFCLLCCMNRVSWLLIMLSSRCWYVFICFFLKNWLNVRLRCMFVRFIFLFGCFVR